ncbi:MAG TPA: glycerol-3-phosphate acyltransferase, partial [Acidimicrobiia bacterium]|nr:glycerol-3-phosphate acyltransferase [Acidimicrobiia bacterium]
ETAVLAVVWFAIARGLRKASVASIVCATAFPIIVAARGRSVLDISVTAGLAALVVARHFANVRRLVRGQELGLGDEDDGGSVAA